MCVVFSVIRTTLRQSHVSLILDNAPSKFSAKKRPQFRPADMLEKATSWNQTHYSDFQDSSHTLLLSCSINLNWLIRLQSRPIRNPPKYWVPNVAQLLLIHCAAPVKLTLTTKGTLETIPMKHGTESTIETGKSCMLLSWAAKTDCKLRL